MLLWILLAAAGMLAYVGWGYFWRPGMDWVDSRRVTRAPDPTAAPGSQVAVTWYGATTLLLTDGETSLLTDGFFSRPGGWLTLARNQPIAPDPRVIEAWVARMAPRNLAAILVLHSHHDHAMDSPFVARMTGAPVLGSESTALVARGAGLAEGLIRVVEPGQVMAFGRFKVTFIKSRHGWVFGQVNENAPIRAPVLESPLTAPAAVRDYKEGGSYSVLIDHPTGSVLVHGSAGWVPGHLKGVKADTVFLGLGGFGRYDEADKAKYLAEVVETVGARRVIPFHFDDFTIPLDQPIRPFPGFYEDFGSAVDFLDRYAASHPALVVETLGIDRPTRLSP